MPANSVGAGGGRGRNGRNGRTGDGPRAFARTGARVRGDDISPTCHWCFDTKLEVGRGSGGGQTTLARWSGVRGRPMGLGLSVEFVGSATLRRMRNASGRRGFSVTASHRVTASRGRKSSILASILLSRGPSRGRAGSKKIVAGTRPPR